MTSHRDASPWFLIYDMEDDFYSFSDATSPGASAGLLSRLSKSLVEAPIALLISIALAPVLIVITTRLTSGRPSQEIHGQNARAVEKLPYWIPFFGHIYQFLSDQYSFMSAARDRNPHGIFAMNLGATTHNIVTDPGLVKGLMLKKESVLGFHSIAWNLCVKFFGIPASSKPKYDGAWDSFVSAFSSFLMKDPHLSDMLKRTVQVLQENIPQMITFSESDVDLQPWERSARTSYVSESESEVSLMPLLRDMMGHAAIPGMFGRAFLEKHPDVLQDIYDMDAGIIYFLMGLPPWTPWPSVMKAHQGRQRVLQACDDQQRALDAMADGKPVDSSWGDLDDVSGLIMKRHAIYREHGIEVKERGDISMIWALVVNSNLIVFWHLLYALSTPDLVDRLRTEVAPYAFVSEPSRIGKFVEAPKLTISHDGLAKNCPLLKSSFLEALRLSVAPMSIRQVASDFTISGDKKSADAQTFALRQGEYVQIPHDLHMRDPKYFKEPEKYDPERFLVQNEDGTVSAEAGTIRPFGGGPSICKGRAYAERECLALVAGVLTFWDFEPAVGGAWTIPKQKKGTGVALPAVDIRARISRRRFDWEQQG